jgi:hypothetical protein
MNEFLESMDRGMKKAEEVAKEKGQKVEDMLFSIGANPGEEQAQSIQDLNAAGKVMPFVCQRSATPAPIPNCHRMKCDGCGEEVWMSPATKMAFDQINKKLIVCLQCLAKHIPEMEGYE